MPPQEEFCDLLGDCRDQSKAQNERPFPTRHEVGIEDLLQERNRADRDQQKKW